MRHPCWWCPSCLRLQVEKLSGQLEAQTTALVAVADATSSAHVSATEREQLKLAETALLLREELALARAEFMASIRASVATADDPRLPASAVPAHQQSISQQQAGLPAEGDGGILDPVEQSLQEAFQSEGVMLSSEIVQGLTAACRTRPSSPPAHIGLEAARGVSPRSLKIRSPPVARMASHRAPAGGSPNG